jgi:hypothetical protein
MPTSTIVAITGTNSRITVNGGSPLNVEKYTISVRVGDINITDFESQSDGTVWEYGVTGIQVADITWEGCYDSGNGPFGYGPGLVQNVNIYVSKTSAISFNFPFMRILSIGVNTDVNGLTKFTVTGKSSGPFTMP